jgi:hypothetical protein
MAVNKNNGNRIPSIGWWYALSNGATAAQASAAYMKKFNQLAPAPHETRVGHTLVLVYALPEAENPAVLETTGGQNVEV